MPAKQLSLIFTPIILKNSDFKETTFLWDQMVITNWIKYFPVLFSEIPYSNTFPILQFPETWHQPHNNPNSHFTIRMLMKPLSFTKVWSSRPEPSNKDSSSSSSSNDNTSSNPNSSSNPLDKEKHHNFKDITIWKMNPQEDYVALGCIVTSYHEGNSLPFNELDVFRTIHKSFLYQVVNSEKEVLWRNKTTALLTKISLPGSKESNSGPITLWRHHKKQKPLKKAGLFRAITSFTINAPTTNTNTEFWKLNKSRFTILGRKYPKKRQSKIVLPEIVSFRESRKDLDGNSSNDRVVVIKEGLKWITDEECKYCMACATEFTMRRRRHHCRKCGRVLCGDCCEKKVRVRIEEENETAKAKEGSEGKEAGEDKRELVCWDCLKGLGWKEDGNPRESRKLEKLKSFTEGLGIRKKTGVVRVDASAMGGTNQDGVKKVTSPTPQGILASSSGSNTSSNNSTPNTSPAPSPTNTNERRPTRKRGNTIATGSRPPPLERSNTSLI